MSESETITVNGLNFEDNAEFGFIAIIAHTNNEGVSKTKEHALLVTMQNQKDQEECVRFLHGWNDFDLDYEEELSLAYYLAARNPDEVRRFLDGLGGEDQAGQELREARSLIAELIAERDEFHRRTADLEDMDLLRAVEKWQAECCGGEA